MGASDDEQSLASRIAAALAWWRDAGVDGGFADEPARWINPAQPTAREAERARAGLREAPRAAEGVRGSPAGAPSGDGLEAASWPTTLALFAPWWLAEPRLDDRRSGGRVPPRGPAGARLMVLVDEPEPDDDERLLSGPQGRVLDGLRAALGIDADEIYLASALVRATPLPDWDDLARRGFGRLLAHHVALVGPERVIAFGSCVLSLLGHDPPNSASPARRFALDGRDIPLLAASGLPTLIARPAAKAKLWREVLDWTA